jgi:hypothetical protein
MIKRIVKHSRLLSLRAQNFSGLQKIVKKTLENFHQHKTDSILAQKFRL